MLKQTKDEITAAVTRVAGLMRPLGRGDVAPWPGIEAAAGFTRESPHWSAFVRRLKRELRTTRGVVLWPVNGVGFKLQTVEEQLRERSRKRQQRAARQLHKDVTELTCLPDAELSHHERVEKTQRVESSRRSMNRVRYVARVAAKFGGPTPPAMPRLK